MTMTTQRYPGPVAIPSMDDLLRGESRGGAVDDELERQRILHESAGVTPLPGAAEMAATEIRRRQLVAWNRGLDDHITNELGRGALEGLGVAGLVGVAVFVGTEVAIVGAVAWAGVALVRRLTGGDS